MEEDSLIEALRAGDEAAFASLVRRWHRPLVRFARAQVPTDALAEDVAQETWLAALRGLDRFEGRSSLATWLFGIARNVARKRGAAEARLVPMSAVLDASGPTVDEARFAADGPLRGHWVHGVRPWPQPEEVVAAGEWLRVLGAAIDALPPAQRLVITLRDVDGLSGPEVASVLEISEGNQRVLLHRARATVRASLAVLAGEEG